MPINTNTTSVRTLEKELEEAKKIEEKIQELAITIRTAVKQTEEGVKQAEETVKIATEARESLMSILETQKNKAEESEKEVQAKIEEGEKNEKKIREKLDELALDELARQRNTEVTQAEENQKTLLRQQTNDLINLRKEKTIRYKIARDALEQAREAKKRQELSKLAKEARQEREPVNTKEDAKEDAKEKLTQAKEASKDLTYSSTIARMAKARIEEELKKEKKKASEAIKAQLKKEKKEASEDLTYSPSTRAHIANGTVKTLPALNPPFAPKAPYIDYRRSIHRSERGMMLSSDNCFY